ncbi:MAG: hypothetical protein RMN25_14465, partial [Anaerolineae bacterium]|nr:hypothetical protein [Thermoflexales bacterium]MDW8408974.1 hypothetical protein [Anaerolineae bacterium]
MRCKAIYLTAGPAMDMAVISGLRGAGCSVIHTQSIAQTFGAIAGAHEPIVLVADVQADALTCLILLRESFGRLPPTMLIDRDGQNITFPIQAMQLGVADYVLASDPDVQRETSARLLVERNRVTPAYPVNAPSYEPTTLPAAGPKFEWDPVAYIISVDGRRVHLSPAEGRLFNLLIANRGRTVDVRELMRHALRKPDV